MSGFEVVGVVLGAVPLVISALENYAEGVRTIKRFFGWESQLTQLILSLRIQHTKFKLNLQKLLRAAAPDYNIRDIPDDHTSFLWQGDLATRVEKYLDASFTAFREVVADYEACLKKIAYKLKHVNRPESVSQSIISWSE